MPRPDNQPMIHLLRHRQALTGGELLCDQVNRKINSYSRSEQNKSTGQDLMQAMNAQSRPLMHYTLALPADQTSPEG